MALPAEKRDYTFADVLEWPEDEQAELIYGVPYMMAPPLRAHQEIVYQFGRQLGNYLEGKTCKVYPAPFAVRLFEKEGDRPEDVDVMVEPDLSVICDRGKLDEYGCKGAPDLVVEVLSPSTRRHDRVVKLELYERAGVREYWIVNPEDKTVQVFLLENGRLVPREDYGKDELAKVGIFEDCAIDLSRVFAELS